MVYVPTCHEEGFKTFLSEKGIIIADTWEERDLISEEDYFEFIHTLIEEPHPPLIKNPSSRDLARLHPGAIVAIHVTCVDDTPYVVELKTIDHVGLDYDCDGELDPPMIGVKMTDLPEKRQHKFSVGEDGIQAFSGSHISRIYSWGKAVHGFRNCIFGKYDKFIANAIENNKRRGGSRVSMGGHFHPRFAPANRFGQELTEEFRGRSYRKHHSYQNRYSKGRYEGELFILTRAILSRQAMLDIDRDIAADKFAHAYIQAGKPGWVSEARDHCFNLGFADPSETGPGFQGIVNVKAFRKWVLKNHKRLMPSVSRHKKESIQRAIDYDAVTAEIYNRDMNYELNTSRMFDDTLEDVSDT